MQSSLTMIRHFLSHRRLALIGVSRNPKDFSAHLFHELSRRGYDVVPVNPRATSIQGSKCFARAQDVWPPVEAALLMTSPPITDVVVRDCADAEINWIWMYRASGAGAVSDNAVHYCQQMGMQVIAGQCPLMFLSETGTVHRLHALLQKITGRYPRENSKAA
ncbi:MAG TPA: CoA-binding protein [Terriglobales bacterium]|nr:CoA-binding protein [Terriglobales bacterium]